jgi:predicted nucleic acid-binding protein
MSIISNTAVLSNFASVYQLALLQRLYQLIYIPSEVVAEIQAGLDEGYTFCAGLQSQIHLLRPEGWIGLASMTTESEFARFSNLLSKLHHGEASCLAIANSRNWIMLTDDQPARREASQPGVRLSGTLGCLLLAVHRQICTLEEANHLLQLMIEGGYRSPTTNLSTLLPQSH